MKPSEWIDSYGDCSKAFEPSIDDTNALLAILGCFSREFALGADIRRLFGGLLSNFLKLTHSEYGFIGVRLLRSDGTPYLKTEAITNIAWDEASLAFYERHAPDGLEFGKLDSLFGHVICKGNTLISNHPPSDPRAGGTPPGHPAIDTFLGIPLFLGDNFLGMVGIANRPGGYDKKLVEYLDPLVSNTAALMHAAQMDKMASHDALTGLANRRKLDECLAAESSRHARHGGVLSLLLIDIDHFKDINDSYGHPVGDRCIIYIAELLASRIRSEDIVARYGGEEFVVLLPDTPAHEARGLAEHLRLAVSKKPFTTQQIQQSIAATISVGVASQESNDVASYADMLERVDKALYTAKNRGRNLVCCAPDTD